MNWPSPKATDQIYSPNFVDFQACKGAQLTEEVVLILVNNMFSLSYSKQTFFLWHAFIKWVFICQYNASAV